MKYILSKNLTKGFSLIEIIVVLIILGVLVTAAAASYFDWIKKASAAEASQTLKSIKDQIEPCLLAKSSDAEKLACISGITSIASSANFDYTAGYSVTNPSSYYIIAASKNVDPSGAINSPLCGDAVGILWAPGNERSGVMLCRGLDASIQIKGFGLYNGLY